MYDDELYDNQYLDQQYLDQEYLRHPRMDWLVIDDVTAAYSRHFMPLCLLSRRLRKARSRPMQLEPISEIPQ